MAMTKCAECGHDISTKADRCPHCGAPNAPEAALSGATAPTGVQSAPFAPKRNLCAVEWLVIIAAIPLAVFLFTIPLRSPASPVPEGSDVSVQTSKAPPVPAHRYTFHQGGTYGYARQVSAADTATGLATVPLELVVYSGKSGDVYSFGQMVSTSVSRELTCREPCENMVVNEWAYGGFQQQVVTVVPGSVLAAMVEDARNGMLTPYVRK